MNSDYRVSITWRDCLKRKKLHRKLGPEAVLAAMDLWSVAAEQRPDGVLRGWDADDIELQVNWVEKPGELVSVLVELRLLDIDENTKTYSIHNWMKWNHWATGAEKRSAKARAAAEARWAKQGQENANSNAPSISEHAGSDADGMQSRLQDNANSNPPYLTHPNPSFPNPTNLPPPTPETGSTALVTLFSGQGQRQDQDQVVGGDVQDPEQGQGQNPKPGFEKGDEGDIEGLLRLLWKYRASEPINDPESFFPWKRGKLKKEGLTEKDLQDLVRLRKKEVREVAKEEQERRASVEEEVSNRRKKADENRLYAKYEQLPELEREWVESQAQGAGTSPGSRLWRSQIALIMRDYNSCSGEVGEVANLYLSGLHQRTCQ